MVNIRILTVPIHSRLYVEQLFSQIAEDLISDKVITTPGNLCNLTITNITIVLIYSAKLHNTVKLIDIIKYFLRILLRDNN